MNFNLQARAELAEYINDGVFTQADVTQEEIKQIAKVALALFEKYNNAREDSHRAQYEYYEALLTPLKKLSVLVHNKKTLWGKLIAFFGFRSSAEKELSTIIATIKITHANASTQHDQLYYPNFLLRLMRFFGIELKTLLKSPNYDQYSAQDKLTYLSHHLMGTTNLTHHKILHGKSVSTAYQHFRNDLHDFIQHESSRIDKQMQKQFTYMLEQIDNCAKLANELDTISILNQFDNSEEIQQKFIFDLSYQVQKAIAALPPGESLIIPHGYRTQSDGHATVIECQKIDEQNVIFKIINTGAGETAIASYKTIFFSLISNKETRPIKVTSPLNLSDLINNQFIEMLLAPVIICDDKSAAKMNNLFVSLYNEGKLHDDKRSLTLQTNGTCAHSSLLAWFKAKVPASTFLLFNYFTLHKALQRLKQFTANELSAPPENIDNILNELHIAALKTITIADNEFTIENKQIVDENNLLKLQLSSILSKKGKKIEAITNFTEYYEKKCRNNKLSDQEQEQVSRADPMTIWLPPQKTAKAKGFWSGFLGMTDDMTTEIESSDRAQKAIIAKKISGHSTFLAASEATQSSFKH